ncbi:hypothetical protein U9M48_041816 [Paspalum notatum var. saurae]|uniref:DUF4220 domain-containing protein n=1 Tax=Paspalum notatum var. saurae TaxID=547442 RepID=A0AAQ3UVE9_PASNO
MGPMQSDPIRVQSSNKDFDKATAAHEGDPAQHPAPSTSSVHRRRPSCMEVGRVVAVVQGARRHRCIRRTPAGPPVPDVVALRRSLLGACCLDRPVLLPPRVATRASWYVPLIWPPLAAAADGSRRNEADSSVADTVILNDRDGPPHECCALVGEVADACPRPQQPARPIPSLHIFLSAIPGWFRFIMWLAYLAGDALAIYALATLFNRHKGDQGHGGGGLEVVWAPVLLIHLGGHDGITAYDIEDNELWSRHLLTAVSQVTVAVYVFCKSWPGGDVMLLLAAVALFVSGVLKCFAKPWALKRASINSLVSSPAAQRTPKQDEGRMCPLEEYVKEAKAFVQLEQEGEAGNKAHGARASVDSGAGDRPPSQQQGLRFRAVVQQAKEIWKRERQITKAQLVNDIKNSISEPAQRTGKQQNGMGALEKYVKAARRASASASDREPKDEEGDEAQAMEGEDSNPFTSTYQRESILRGEACKLFVDLSSPYHRRLVILKYLWVISEEKAYGHVRQGLASAFLLLYTKLKTAVIPSPVNDDDLSVVGVESAVEIFFRQCVQMSQMLLPWAAIGLFHHSHREAYDDVDIKITYVIFCCTAVLEFYSTYAISLLELFGSHRSLMSKEHWPEMVAQYSLIGFVARNTQHASKMRIVSLFGCKDFLDQRWCMEPCFSSARITLLVLQYLKDGWMTKIQEAASYRMFNDNRGHSAIEGNERLLGWSIKGPFDESVLLWHIATDFCFFLSPFSDHKCDFAETPSLVWLGSYPADHMPQPKKTSSKCGELTACKAVQCRQMSNYMAYLLYVNPEMLLPGTRRNLFTTAHDELREIIRPSLFAAAYKVLEDIIKDNKKNVYKGVTTTIKEIKDILKDKKRNPLSWSQLRPTPMKEEEIMDKVIRTMLDKSKKGSEEVSRKVSKGESKKGPKEESIGSSKESFIDDAWTLAQGLLSLGDEKMWKVIEHVWVEMLCFSASRCRGYLHAKALGSGGEFLTYVWLLLFYMGAETLTERLQREERPIPSQERDNIATAPLTFDARHGTTSSTSEIHIHNAPSTSKVHINAFPSTSEIHISGEDMD